MSCSPHCELSTGHIQLPSARAILPPGGQRGCHLHLLGTGQGHHCVGLPDLYRGRVPLPVSAVVNQGSDANDNVRGNNTPHSEPRKGN